ncbi:MAG: hypothetical protein ACPG7F_17010 [Aggregatilineales bacterium]
MPVEIRPDNPAKTILHITISNQWTWDEFYRIEHETKVFLKDAPESVAYIVNFSEADLMPQGIDLARVQRILAFDHLQSDSIFVVGVNTMLMAVIGAMKRAGTPIIAVNSIEDARLMAQKRPALRVARHNVTASF